GTYSSPIVEILPSIPTIDNTVSEEVRRKTEPLHEQMPTVQPLSHQLPVHEWQEEAKLATDKLAIHNQLTVHEWQEEARLTTDKLAIHNQLTIHESQEEMKPSIGKSATKVVDSLLVPLPSRPVPHTFWEYSEKIPIVKSSSQLPDTRVREK